jgi:lysine-N-methylase
MEKFRCLGSECEDTCCKQWTVKIDRTHFAALQRLSEKHPSLTETVSEYVKRLNTPQDGNAYAQIEMDENGFCPFLDESKLCRIQSAGGFEALGNTCTFYPRVIYRIDDTVEVAGALSCPEVVRGCLSSDNRPGLIEVSEQILPREADTAVILRIDTDNANTYERLFPVVRQYFTQLAYDPMLTSKQKMYLLNYSAYRLSEHYHNECGEEAESIVHNELHRLSSKDIKPNLLQRYESFVDEEKLGLITIQSIFLIRSQHYENEPLTPYIRDIINSYIIELNSDNPFTTEIDGLYSVYHGRKKAIIDIAKSQIEDYLSRHLQNSLLREWYIRFPDPFGYMLMLCLRHAMLRFLLYSHPSIYRWCLEDQEHDTDTLHKVIEELSVEMLYLFSRSIEHDTTFLQNIYSALTTEEMMQLHTALCLLRGI